MVSDHQDTISYAILHKTPFEHHVFLNDLIYIDQWIAIDYNDNDNNLESTELIYKYIFRCTSYKKEIRYQDNSIADFMIGFIVPQFARQFSRSSTLKCTNVSIKDSIGRDSTGYSMGWWSSGYDSSFYYQNHVKECKYKKNNKLKETKYIDIEWNRFVSKDWFQNTQSSYFLFELNLLLNKIYIVCLGFENNNSKIIECDIPKQLLSYLKKAKRFRVGVSLSVSDPGRFAVGVVRM